MLTYDDVLRQDSPSKEDQEWLSATMEGRIPLLETVQADGC